MFDVSFSYQNLTILPPKFATNSLLNAIHHVKILRQMVDHSVYGDSLNRRDSSKKSVVGTIVQQ